MTCRTHLKGLMHVLVGLGTAGLIVASTITPAAAGRVVKITFVPISLRTGQIARLAYHNLAKTAVTVRFVLFDKEGHDLLEQNEQPMIMMLKPGQLGFVDFPVPDLPDVTVTGAVAVDADQQTPPSKLPRGVSLQVIDANGPTIVQSPSDLFPLDAVFYNE